MTELRVKNLIQLACAAAITANILYSFPFIINSLRTHPGTAPVPGLEYADLKPYTRSRARVGYIKDWTVRHETVHRLLTAQFQLAPTVLDADESSHELSLIDASTPRAADKIGRAHV